MRKLHAAPVRRSVGRAGADRLPETTAAPPFFRDSAANPMTDMTTGGRHSAITFAASSNLPIFCISNVAPPISRRRRTDDEIDKPFVVFREVLKRAGATTNEFGAGARLVTAVVQCRHTGDRAAKSRAGGWKACRAASSSLLLCGARAPGFRSPRLPLADKVLVGPPSRGPSACGPRRRQRFGGRASRTGVPVPWRPPTRPRRASLGRGCCLGL